MMRTRFVLAAALVCGCLALATAQGNESHHDLPDAPDGGVSLGLCKYVPAKGNSTCAVSFKSAAAISAWALHVHVGNTTDGDTVKGVIYGGQATADGMAVGSAGGHFSALFPGSPNASSPQTMPPQAKEHVLAQIKVAQPTGANATKVTNICIHGADFYNATGHIMDVEINGSSLCAEGGSEEGSSSWFNAGVLFLILFGVVVVLAGGYFGFTWFKKRQAAKRHAANVYGYNQENI